MTLAIFTSLPLAATPCRYWLASPSDFDGSTPIPVDVRAIVEDVTYLSRPGRAYRLEFDVAAIAAQAPELRELLLELKRSTRTHAPEREREVGAAIITYEDSRRRIIRFTSNRVQEILARDMAIAGLGPYSKPNPRAVTSLLPIHTHPNQANPRVDMRWTFPGPKDYAKLRELKSEWRRVHGREIEVVGLVLPTGPNLDEIVYRFLGEDISEEAALNR